MYLSLRAAAKEAGIAKTTVIRAIRSGKLSAQRDETGDWAIDPSELHRVYPRKAESPEDQGGPGCAPLVPDRDATPSGPPATTLDRERTAALEAKVQALQELVQRLDQDKRDLREERDRWAAQAERLALAPPRRSWWPWRRTA